ncbi:hypothetical protein B0G81_3374 [Paraburkholderia sp. BL6665CI2N2]|nr:hypothetical protein B0G81_3374 [Paraburkholderia sp. BL6665CI2N2]
MEVVNEARQEEASSDDDALLPRHLDLERRPL